MRKGLTELVFILDKSGSMSGLEEDTIGGFNGMIRRQKEKEGEALVSTVLFSSKSTVIHDRVPLESVEPLTSREYYVGGNTALIDAVGEAVRHIGNVHKYARDEDRPENTVFVITTDGMENASRFYSADRVRAMIRRQKEEYGWEFLFLGANIDAVETAEHLGIERDRAANFRSDSRGHSVLFASVGEAVERVRSHKGIGEEWKADIEADFESRK